MKPKTKRGGSRPGAGRPKKEPTKTLSYRVPENTAWIIDSVCRTCIADLQNRDLSGLDYQYMFLRRVRPFVKILLTSIFTDCFSQY